MLLGKRPRPPMKRTTSLSEITFDVSPGDDDVVMAMAHSCSQPSDRYPQGLDQRYYAAAAAAAPSPRTPHRRSSADFAAEASHFLRSCGLCKRRLVPSRDIYMYRGDTAFCSLECRQQQMNQDERLEKCSVASKKEATASSGAAASGETVAAM